jgi:hypothetical protein
MTTPIVETTTTDATGLLESAVKIIEGISVVKNNDTPPIVAPTTRSSVDTTGTHIFTAIDDDDKKISLSMLSDDGKNVIIDSENQLYSNVIEQIANNHKTAPVLQSIFTNNDTKKSTIGSNADNDDNEQNRPQNLT